MKISLLLVKISTDLTLNRGTDEIFSSGKNISGYVGAATAFALQQSGLDSELVLVDIDQYKVRGEILDLSHASSLGLPRKL